MENKTITKLKQEISNDFEPVMGRKLTEKETSEALFNLGGFAKVLLKMKSEKVEFERTIDTSN